jgi:hypothetical protein
MELYKISQVKLEYWIFVAGGVAIAALLAALIVVRWRRRRSDILGALRAVAVDRLENVLVPNGMGGHIQIEHLLLTAHGILVVDVKPFDGTVFASDRMNDWTVMGRQGRFGFPNPQSTLYDRVAAVKQLLRDVQVMGYVLFPDAADFSKGRPKDVILPRELAERYKKPDRSATEKVGLAFAQHWESICQAAEPAHLAAPKRR